MILKAIGLVTGLLAIWYFWPESAYYTFQEYKQDLDNLKDEKGQKVVPKQIKKKVA